jgi:hypothetical protein
MGLFGGDAFAEAEKNVGSGGARRPIIPEFYLKEGESKSVVFCDDSPGIVNGHKIMIDQFKAPRWFTCSAGLHPCVFCEKKYSRTWIGPMTVLVDSWTEGKTGQVIQWGKRIMMASQMTLKKLKIKKDNRIKAGEPGLVGGMFSMSRVSKQNAIDDCEFLKRVTPQMVGVPDFAPLNYDEILAVRPRAEIEDLMQRHVVRDCFAKKAAPVSGDAPAGAPSSTVSY